MAGIDRDYWLEFAKDGVSNSIKSREKSADRLDTFLTWIWGIYTSIFALASLLDYVSSSFWQLLWVSQPILIIMLSRYFCTLVSMPSSNDDNQMSADPNDVASIIDSFKLIVADKKKKLEIAKFATLVSIVSITVALMGYNYCDPNKEMKQELETLKLKKEVESQKISMPKTQQNLNDSIKLLNEYYDIQTETRLKKLRLRCIEMSDNKCLDSLKLLSK